jgi:hypothetical protein
MLISDVRPQEKMMNIEEMKEGLTITGNVIGILKTVTDTLPSGEKRDEAERLLVDAEQKMKEAEARLAHELGFPICKRCWPPEIMTHNNEGEFICRNCGQLMPDSVLPVIRPGRPGSDGLETW